jgi:hypothetical protein
MKNPTVLAILDFIFLGLGTFLLGRRRAYGAVMFIGGSLLRFEELRIAPLASGVWNPHWVPAVVGLTLIGLAMAREVFVEARQAA